MAEIKYLEINDVTRMINVPANLLLGVIQDKNVERLYFRCKKIVGDNIDLSKHQIYINYINALDKTGERLEIKEPGTYHCEDVTSNGDYITFSWLLSENVFKKRGFLAFSVNASDGEKTRWNTFPAIGTVLITITGGLQEASERYPDIITQLLNRMNKVEELATPEAMQGYVNTYLAAHPAEIDPELLDPKKCAPANVVGQLKQDLNNISEISPNIASNDITDNVIYGGENILEQNYNTGYCTIVIPFKDEYKGKTLYFSMDGIPVLCRMIRGLIPGNQIDSNFSLSSPAYSFLVPNIETRISRLSFSFGKLQGDYNKIQIEYDCVSKYRPPNITYLSEKGYKYSNFYIPMTSNPNLILSLRDNYIMSLEGTENYNKSYKYTNKIPVSEGDIIFFSNDGAAIEARNVTAYKGNVAVQNKGAERVLMYKVPTDIDSIVITFNASYTKLQAEHDAVTFYNNSRNKVITEDSLYLKNTYKKIANIAEYTPIGLHSFLPSDIYIAHGRTIEIYNHQVCINLSADMHIQWVCTVGNALKRKFRFPSTINIGDYPLTCNIINNKKDVIWTSTVNVHIIDETLDSTIKICPIGDSITNNKSWLAELINLSKGKINFVGTKSLNVKDSNRVARTGGHEGRGGWTAYTYNAKSTKNGESNPFYNSEKGRFDWAYYVTHSLDGNFPDAVIIALGMNDLIYDHTAIKQMIDYIQEDAPKMKIIIQFPQYRANQNGLGVQTNNEGYVTTIGDYEYESDLKIFNFQQNLLEAISGYENVYYSWTTLGFDREYGYAMSQKSVNPRISFTELVPTESTHPSDEGNFQIADVCYGAIIEATLSTIVEE